MSEARECLCKSMDTPNAGCGFVEPKCDRCNGTGKVWPSVEGEVIATLESTGNNTGKVTFAVMAMAAFDEPVPKGRYRVIVQPLPSPDERGESEESKCMS